LYVHISGISWKHDREDRILGTVADGQQEQIRAIDIDPSNISHYDAVNQLWQLL
jgi:hypothetical protein